MQYVALFTIAWVYILKYHFKIYAVLGWERRVFWGYQMIGMSVIHAWCVSSYFQSQHNETWYARSQWSVDLHDIGYETTHRGTYLLPKFVCMSIIQTIISQTPSTAFKSSKWNLLHMLPIKYKCVSTLGPRHAFPYYSIFRNSPTSRQRATVSQTMSTIFNSC